MLKQETQEYLVHALDQRVYGIRSQSESLYRDGRSEVQQVLCWDCLLTLENCALIHFVKVFFCTASCSSGRWDRGEREKDGDKIKELLL